MAIQPDRENELTQTKRVLQRVCLGVLPRVKSKLLRAVVESPYPGEYGNEKSFGKVQGSAEKGCHGTIGGISGVLARRHDGGHPVKGDLWYEPRIA